MSSRFTYQIYSKERLIVVSFFGHYNALAFVEALKEVMNKREYDSSFEVILDLSKKEGSYIAFDVRVVTKFISEYRESLPKKVSLISADPVLTAIAFLVKKRVSNYLGLEVYSSLQSILKGKTDVNQDAIAVLQHYHTLV